MEEGRGKREDRRKNKEEEQRLTVSK